MENSQITHNKSILGPEVSVAHIPR